MTDSPCPCNPHKRYAECCQPYITRQSRASTPEILMRSRYTAYAIGDTGYLLDTWHPSTRPSQLELDTGHRWIRLKVVEAHDDQVEFIATCKLQGKAHKLHEISRFLFEDGNWYYLDGDTSHT